MITAWRPDGSGGLRTLELPRPDLADDEVLVRVEAACVGLPEVTATDPQRTPGSGAVGVAEATGPGAAELAGRRLLLPSVQPCGDCEVCRRGGAAVCPTAARPGRTVDGALASHVVARARWLLPLDGGLELPGPAAALLAREAALAHAMYARTGVAPGEPAVVLGAGPVARFLVEVLQAKGARPIAVGGDAGWAGWLAARDLPRVDPGDQLVDRVLEAARLTGRGARPFRIFDTAGDAGSRARAVALAGPAATVTFLAGELAAPTGPVDLGQLWERGVTVIGVPEAHPDLLCEVAALAVRGVVDVAAAAEVVGPADLPALIERVRAGLPVARAGVVAWG